MKPSILLFSLLIMCSFCVMGQTKSVQILTIKTPEILCEKCKLQVETYLKRHDGLLETNINYRKGETRVKFLSDRTDIEQLKTAIANCGFDADDVLADPEAYRKLPISCKKKSDGGGHPAPKTQSHPAN